MPLTLFQRAGTRPSIPYFGRSRTTLSDGATDHIAEEETTDVGQVGDRRGFRETTMQHPDLYDF